MVGQGEGREKREREKDVGRRLIDITRIHTILHRTHACIAHIS